MNAAFAAGIIAHAGGISVPQALAAGGAAATVHDLLPGRRGLPMTRGGDGSLAVHPIVRMGAWPGAPGISDLFCHPQRPNSHDHQGYCAARLGSWVS